MGEENIEKIDRRAMIKVGMAAAAGGLAVKALKDVPQVNASTGNMQYGATNDAGGDQTTLKSTASRTLMIFNDVTTGSVHAVYASTDGGNGSAGVWGHSENNGNVKNFGLYGRADGQTGRGVVGYAFHSSGKNFGGRFQSNSTSGVGCSGYCIQPSGPTIGVKGEVDSGEGKGVVGINKGKSLGPGVGVYGENNAAPGFLEYTYGIYGRNNSTASRSIGVHGYSASSSGTGVRGIANGSNAEGVYGLNGSGGGTGTYGFYSGASGAGKGVHGKSNSSTGYGVYAECSGGIGLYGKTTSPGGWALVTVGKSKFGGTVIPTIDNKYKLGYGKKRWKEVWAANGTIQTSLSKFKENIESPSDIDYLSTVPEPIYFNWKDGDDKQRHLGFMGDHLPEVAKEGDGGVYTSSVTAILCGAVKQLKDEIDQLREENQELRKQIETRN